MSHITQEQAVDLCRQVGIEFDNDDIRADAQMSSAEQLCNAAIQWHIDGAALAQPEPTCKETGVCVQSGLYVSAKVAQPDCRTCANLYWNTIGEKKCAHNQHSTIECTNGDKYEAAPAVVLWRTE